MVGIECLNEVDKPTIQKLISKDLEATVHARTREVLADSSKFAGTFWNPKPKSRKSQSGRAETNFGDDYHGKGDNDDSAGP